jgi:hypothetical protein
MSTDVARATTKPTGPCGSNVPKWSRIEDRRLVGIIPARCPRPDWPVMAIQDKWHRSGRSGGHPSSLVRLGPIKREVPKNTKVGGGFGATDNDDSYDAAGQVRHAGG